MLERGERQSAQNIRLLSDPKVGGYFALIASRLVRATGRPDIGFRFTLLNSAQVNAFALPGGFVYITRGLVALANNEAEIAGVIGHEIGHVVARHISKRIEHVQRAERVLLVGRAQCVWKYAVPPHGQFHGR